ncbi:MAG TPA: hypothetical protein VGP06_03125 [Janthinobacterium sp.]|nr:hypothetical protein [Janthinobacterium sp.]
MMAGALPWWWLALPVLLLPVLWHRQRRQRLSAEPLATARFLPPSAPHQLRVWAWADRLLLLLRCLMLLVLIACLAALSLPWRGDTVLLDGAVDPAWAEQQIQSAGFGNARRLVYEASSKAGAAALKMDPAEVLPWLQRHEGEWRPDARLLLVAGADGAAMPAHAPRLAHAIELRVKAAPAAAAPLIHRVALASTPQRAAAWRAMFAAFAAAGTGNERYALADAPDAHTELIVWDREGAPPPAWRAPLWWVGAAAAAALPELAGAPALQLEGLTLKYADSPRGRLWTLDAPRDADGARAIYLAWRRLKGPAPAYPLSAQTLAAAAPAPAPASGLDAAPAQWLMLALAILFFLERILTHARRT